MAAGANDEGSSSPSGHYSRAFDNMVTEGPDDIVGLLAYALLKQNIREEARQGVRGDSALRNPTRVTVNLYRTSAMSRLNDFAAQAIDEARSEIQESAVLGHLRATESALKAHVTAATGTGRAIWTNLVAWLLTGALTIITILLLAMTNAQEKFVDRLSHAVSDAVGGQSGTTPLPTKPAPPD